MALLPEFKRQVVYDQETDTPVRATPQVAEGDEELLVNRDNLPKLFEKLKIPPQQIDVYEADDLVGIHRIFNQIKDSWHILGKNVLKVAIPEERTPADHKLQRSPMENVINGSVALSEARNERWMLTKERLIAIAPTLGGVALTELGVDPAIAAVPSIAATWFGVHRYHRRKNKRRKPITQELLAEHGDDIIFKSAAPSVNNSSD